MQSPWQLVPVGAVRQGGDGTAYLYVCVYVWRVYNGNMHLVQSVWDSKSSEVDYLTDVYDAKYQFKDLCATLVWHEAINRLWY